jgi:hypothetical protein
MFATIASMRWWIELTEEDLELAEQACRSLAATYRRDAERAIESGPETVRHRQRGEVRADGGADEASAGSVGQLTELTRGSCQVFRLLSD